MPEIGKGFAPYHSENAVKLPYYGTSAVDCRVSVKHLLYQTLSQREIVVYGDYVLFFIYSYQSEKGKKNYALKTIESPFCEHIPIETKQDIKADELGEVKAEIHFEPVADCKKQNTMGSVWNIHLRGDIEANLHTELQTTVFTAPAGRNQEITAEETGVKVYKIGQNDFPINELMDMDENLLDQVLKTDEIDT